MNKLTIFTCSLFSVAPMAHSALDVLVIIDTTGSVGKLLPNWKKNMVEKVLLPLKNTNKKIRVALASHEDFPFKPYGNKDDKAYTIQQNFTEDLSLFQKALENLSTGSGMDIAESQNEAIYQACTGAGRDLNGNGSYNDSGDIKPHQIGFNSITESIIMHFTSTKDFHNDGAVEPDYPFAGVVNHPATTQDAEDAMVLQKTRYFSYITTSLSRSNLDVASNNNQDIFMRRRDHMGATAPERLAKSTGGAVYHIGNDGSKLEEAINNTVEISRLCPVGEEPVELPFDVICVPIDEVTPS